MKIGLIRHFPVNHLFLKGIVSQSQVLQWFQEYNQAAVHRMQVAVGGPWDVCYSSQLARAKRTAEAVYQGEFLCSELLNEPFPDPVFKQDIKLPFLLWAMLIRVALLGNHSSQSQRKAIIEHRLREFLPQLFSHGDANVLIISHAFTMEILSRLLIKEGFTGRKLSRPENGRLYVYEKN